MSREEQVKWDRLYAERDYVPRDKPSPFLESWVGRIAPGRALDIACGAGRHALRLAEAGFAVDAVDISAVAVEMGAREAERRGVSIDFRVADLDELSIKPAAYGLITVFRFHSPALWVRLPQALAPDGWLLVEHHLLTSANVSGPGAHFRLQPGELLRSFAALRVVHYSETLEEEEGGKAIAIARCAACNGNPGF